MKVTYTGPHDAVELVTPSGSRVLVKNGDEVEVADKHGRELLKQTSNWAPAKRARQEVKKNGD